MPNIDVAVAELDEMTSFLINNSKGKHGFENDDVIWLIKAWTKVVINLGLLNELRPYWVMKRVPPKIGGRRSEVLMRALDDYGSILEKTKSPTGDFYVRAREAMVNFVWEYRLRISGETEQDFVHQIQKIVAMSNDALMKEEVMNMDRSI